MPFSPADLDLLRTLAEIRIAPEREDGTTGKPVIIWVVVVDGQLFVRSVRGEQGTWYRHVLRSRRATLHVDGDRINVTAEPVSDAAVNQKASDVFRAKYGRRWPGPTAGIVRPAATRATFRLTPA
jgi:hypothetical protein